MQIEDGELMQSNRLERVPNTLPYLPDADGDETTCREIRGKIAVRVGAKENPDTALTITTLNSAYAYLTGEFHTHPRWIGTVRSPGKSRVRTDLAVVLIDYDERIGSYVPAPGEDKHWESRPYRKRELLALYRAMVEEGDQRPWAQQHGSDDNGE